MSDWKKLCPLDEIPPLGSRVTFRHDGLTANGTPRFARYLRPRADP